MNKWAVDCFNRMINDNPMFGWLRRELRNRTPDVFLTYCKRRNFSSGKYETIYVLKTFLRSRNVLLFGDVNGLECSEDIVMSSEKFSKWLFDNLTYLSLYYYKRSAIYDLCYRYDIPTPMSIYDSSDGLIIVWSEYGVTHYNEKTKLLHRFLQKMDPDYLTFSARVKLTVKSIEEISGLFTMLFGE